MDGRWFDVPTASAAPGSDPGAARRAGRTRARLVGTAARRFAVDGYHRTTLREVLAEAGVTKGALYFHFDSKLELAQAVCDEASREWTVMLAVLASRGLDPLQELLVQADATFVRFAHDLPFRAALRVGGEAAELDGLLARWRAAWEERTTTLFDRAAEQGLLLAGARPHVLGRHAVAMMLGHQAFTEHLPPTDADAWARMSESWDGVLSAVASADWITAWRGSGWHQRARPCPGEPRAP